MTHVTCEMRDFPALVGPDETRWPDYRERATGVCMNVNPLHCGGATGNIDLAAAARIARKKNAYVRTSYAVFNLFKFSDNHFVD